MAEEFWKKEDYKEATLAKVIYRKRQKSTTLKDTNLVRKLKKNIGNMVYLISEFRFYVKFTSSFFIMNNSFQSLSVFR